MGELLVKIDGVFSGGGVKAIAFIGALEVVEEKGYEFERVAGTSAGAIVASFIAAGYKSNEIQELFEELHLNKLLDPPKLVDWLPFTKWLSLYFRMGIYKGKKLEKWIEEKLEQKGVRTFSDLPQDSLKVIVSDLTLGRLVVLPDDLKRIYGVKPRQFSVARAVRMSAGLPYFFIPEKLQGEKERQKSIIVDGGLLSNFPLWVFTSKLEKRVRPILGMKLSKSIDHIPPRVIKNAIDMFQALFATMKEAHDARYISKTEAADIIFIPIEKVDTTDFDMNEETKKGLIELGNERAAEFLKKWKG